ncbi:MAG: histidine phosphatase family protein [Defluviitaleaceae bacterium]|nr:histidine phosphatase family protein [Defluviitaleaceae bacterium]
MTNIYFVRHATPDRTHGTDATYPLTPKGQQDVAMVTAYLQDKNIDAVLSSPFKRSYDTVVDFAKSVGLTVEVIEDFRERKISNEWIGEDEFRTFAKNQWADHTYKLPDGESYLEVQTRNIAALTDVLTRYDGKNLVVGTHGTALGSIIFFYDVSFTFEEWQAMPMPWVAKLTFDGQKFISVEKICLFQIAQSAPRSETRKRSGAMPCVVAGVGAEPHLDEVLNV